MGGLHDFLGGFRGTLQGWWNGIRGHRAHDWESISIPEPDNIIFTPLVPDGGLSPTADGTADIDPAPPVCPVTRQELEPGSRIYQCRVCGICYSPEGWQFLKQADRGQCCACRCRNTVLPMIKPQ